MMRSSLPVTPWYVLPKLSPEKLATHGGASGSSVWRGGLPVQRLVLGFLPTAMSGGASSAGVTPSPTVSEPASPSDEKFPAGGWFESASGGTGAYSTVSVGLVWGELSAEGTTGRSRSRASPTVVSGM